MDYGDELKNSSGFGAKLMSQMGWSKGDGLGKAGQGRKTIITVTKREDGVGVRRVLLPPRCSGDKVHRLTCRHARSWGSVRLTLRMNPSNNIGNRSRRSRPRS